MMNQHGQSKHNNQRCEEARALLPAYSVGIADAAEAQLVESLLDVCPELLDDLATYHTLAEQLVHIVPETEAPPPAANILQGIFQRDTHMDNVEAVEQARRPISFENQQDEHHADHSAYPMPDEQHFPWVADLRARRTHTSHKRDTSVKVAAAQPTQPQAMPQAQVINLPATGFKWFTPIATAAALTLFGVYLIFAAGEADRQFESQQALVLLLQEQQTSQQQLLETLNDNQEQLNDLVITQQENQQQLATLFEAQQQGEQSVTHALMALGELIVTQQENQQQLATLLDDQQSDEQVIINNLETTQQQIIDLLALQQQGQQQLASLISEQASNAQLAALLPLSEGQQHHRELRPTPISDLNARANFIWNDSAQVGAVLVVGLPPLADGQQYQLWLESEADTISLGTFPVDADGTGILVFQSPTPIDTFDRIGIGVASEAGSQLPTAPHLITGQI